MFAAPPGPVVQQGGRGKSLGTKLGQAAAAGLLELVFTEPALLCCLRVLRELQEPRLRPSSWLGDAAATRDPKSVSRRTQIPTPLVPWGQGVSFWECQMCLAAHGCVGTELGHLRGNE